MRKVDAFKRELPHCMHLLKDAIDTLKKERLRFKGKQVVRVTEEFIPLKNGYDSEGPDGRAKRSNDVTEKRNWMSSVQLWSTPIHYEHTFDTRDHDSPLSLKSKHQEDEASLFESRGGAFLPFKKPSGLTINQDKSAAPIHGLSLSIPVPEADPIDQNVKEGSFFIRPQMQQPQQRKQRRCWSPELHKRFVDALLQLGGPHTATPKQIRELMKVDGLTNDEVKSHLQKYRLHIRKLPASSAGDYPWLQQNDQSKQTVALSGSPQDHLQKGISAKGGSHSMELDEDEKSESHSWKGKVPVERL
ncbi:hypothetical protein CDL12_00678 [Handroanthus impetiginosus]|uniref:HTH myb-type domain-containing protein n=1 Tax=Handroanthus impetiginosus TaxID=429701 RepID=A0A2G9I9Y4_9LAMI|nr:hypothetical protein CDL12_00678 [Handroanthus impetiginosus]